MTRALSLPLGRPLDLHVFYYQLLLLLDFAVAYTLTWVVLQSKVSEGLKGTICGGYLKKTIVTILRTVVTALYYDSHDKSVD